ncbi:hypothetical protein FGU65_11900 [Methanoculleus sp. FWC-SCC1]|uniref:Uncharacterized protein n=1 Tax=Methanoculleus frigidifontis TaxID=2584085 RepID=A0ABT8MCC3_9EURY|nr:hypothetical protein [Methanoculleus sp. FWC-SCC1]MDN7025585.1 hypothetical protein [Methanoculleus sp. FWC-SCC1]
MAAGVRNEEPIGKNLVNSRMLKRHGSWISCTGCGATVGHLCYTTDASLWYDVTCRCTTSGTVEIVREEVLEPGESAAPLMLRKQVLLPG